MSLVRRPSVTTNSPGRGGVRLVRVLRRGFESVTRTRRDRSGRPAELGDAAVDRRRAAAGTATGRSAARGRGPTGPVAVADRAVPLAQLQVGRVAVVPVGDQRLVRGESAPRDLAEVVGVVDRPQPVVVPSGAGRRSAVVARAASSIDVARWRRRRRRPAGSARGWPARPPSSPAGRRRSPAITSSCGKHDPSSRLAQLQRTDEPAHRCSPSPYS